MTLFVAGARIKSAESDAVDKERDQERAAREAEKNKAGPIFGMHKTRLISSAVTATVEIPDLWHATRSIFHPLVVQQNSSSSHRLPPLLPLRNHLLRSAPTVNVLNVARAGKSPEGSGRRRLASFDPRFESFKRLCLASCRATDPHAHGSACGRIV
ncbi:hypothetical protein GGX14DRAFT_652844 [Mycena pura]|uniref:Uncharacterized protein n=1 Tax=Mycena pura TaxID=153505 RepID=A0AAD6Y5N7_9AGAR|nr:hypothetical protein GGX14DRAFT_652844 [Mycena pura]